MWLVDLYDLSLSYKNYSYEMKIRVPLTHS